MRETFDGINATLLTVNCLVAIEIAHSAAVGYRASCHIERMLLMIVVPHHSLQELLLSSQEAMDVLGGCCYKATYTSLDNDDSLSST